MAQTDRTEATKPANRSAVKPKAAAKKKTAKKPKRKIIAMPQVQGCHIIAIVNQKGGVGKTTTAVNLACALGRLGQKVLLIDCDSQCNATSGAGFSHDSVKASIYDLMSGDVTFAEAVLNTRYDFDIIAGSRNMAGAEVELAKLPEENRFVLLRDSIEEAQEKYNFVLIDCPPSLGMVAVNALTAADGVLVPLQCEYYAVEGLSLLVRTINENVRKFLNPRIKVEGILLTMYDSRAKLTTDVAEGVRALYPDVVYDTVIPRSVRIAEAPSFGMPVLVHDPSNKGSEAYVLLAKEVINRGK